jgi:hypothetical protein
MNWVGVEGGDGKASLENLPNTFCKKIREKLKSVRAIFDVFSRYRYRYRGNTCIIFTMINTIAGEHIPESIKLNNVFARYRLDSGQTTPAIFRPLE